MTGCAFEVILRCAIDPTAHPAQPSCSSKNAPSTFGFALNSAAAGPTRNAIPNTPINIPRTVGQCKGSPRGASASTPTSQKGDVVTNSAAVPLDTQVSEKASAPLPNPSVTKPHKTV